MKIVTHNGVFHADEVIAITILSLICEKNKEKIEIIRTRDKKIIEEALNDKDTIVIDIGGVYNPKMNNYDHHHRDFNVIRESGIKYSSSGLIWLDYGKQLTENKKVWLMIDSILTAVDAVDNGFKDVYSPISNIISSLNPSWMEQSKEAEEAAFNSALHISKLWLSNRIKTFTADEKAVEYVNKGELIFDNKVLLMDTFAPWQSIVTKENKYKDLLYVCFKDKSGDWRIQGVPVAENFTSLKKPLPESWAGLSNDELIRITNVQDAIFCHPSRFIAGARTKEAIISLAEIAINS